MVLDIAINTFMQGIENSFLTSFSEIVAILFDPIILVVISILIAGFMFAKNKKKQSIFFISLIGVTAILIKGFKLVFNRARPLNALIQESSYSFPSGHVTMAVVFFGILAFLLLQSDKSKKLFTWKMFSIISSIKIIILIIGLSRLYLRVHWFTDVLAGFILGGIMLTLGIIIYKKSN